MFARNVGGADRAIRIVLGLVLIAVGFLLDFLGPVGRPHGTTACG